ncbi:MAG: TonB family protein [Kiritimatiellaeota bacterium]|nr:TonB family protein [Kiritimatiellota bacterium]
MPSLPSSAGCQSGFGLHRLPSLKVMRNVLDGYSGRPVALQRTHIGWLGLALSVLLHSLVFGAVVLWTPPPAVGPSDSYTVALWQEPPVIRLAEGAPGTPEPKPPPAPEKIKVAPPPPLPVVVKPEPVEPPPPAPAPVVVPPVLAPAVIPLSSPPAAAMGLNTGDATSATNNAGAAGTGSVGGSGSAPAYGEGGAGGERGAGLQILDPAYWRTVRAAVARRVRYPEAAQRTGVEGLVTIRLTLDTAGRVLAAQPTEASAAPLLVRATLDAIHRAAPFPVYAQPLPPGAKLSVLLPIRFQLEDHAPPAGQR